MRDSLAPTTRAAYNRVLNDFLQYTQRCDIRIITGDSLMAAVAAFLGAKIRAGYAPATCHTLYAALSLQWPEWVGSLRPLHRGLRGWERRRPVVKRPPLVKPLAVAMAMRLVAWGHPAMGVAILLGFHCYLRIGELLSVECWHVVPARSARTGFTNTDAFLHIPKAKTGTQQDVPITDPDVAWLVALAGHAAAERRRREDGGDVSSALLFPYRERAFRVLFARCAASFGLPPEIVQHSMRHGGATHDYASGRLSTEEIRVRGRWKGEKSMQHYVGAMRSALATLRVPEESVQCGAAMAAAVRPSFAQMLLRVRPTTDISTFASLALGRASNGGAAPARALAQPPKRRSRRAGGDGDD